MDIKEQEKAKYERVWQLPEYSLNSPGARHAQKFMNTIQAVMGDKVTSDYKLADYGCGTGRAARFFSKLGFNVTGFDITLSGVEFEQRDNLIFKQQCLWEPIDGVFDFGYCTDVLEHIPTNKVNDVIESIAMSIKIDGIVYFNISTVEDTLGKSIGEQLHLTVRGVKWWAERLSLYFNNVRVMNCYPMECIILATK